MRRVRAVAASAIAILLLGLFAAAPAFAQYVGGAPPPVVLEREVSRKADIPVTPVDVRVSEFQVVTVTEERGRGLALTGADVLQLLALGGLCTAIGLIAIRAGRRPVAFPPSS
jgi:hypothetical protein